MPTAAGSILVTGANGGLGSAIVKHIITSPEFKSYHGLYTVRSTSVPHCSALSALLASTNVPHSHEVLALDLTTLSSVRHIARLINANVKAGRIPPIRVLVLNAAFQDFGKQQWLEETNGGWDLTFVTNYLSHWLLTILLLESMDKERGRIIVIGSQSHESEHSIFFDLLRNLRPLRDDLLILFPHSSPHDQRNNVTQAFTTSEYSTFLHDRTSIEAIAKGRWSPASEDPSFRSGFRRYGASKLFLIMMIFSLQRRLDQDPLLNKICVLGIDPGTMVTGLQRLAAWPTRVLLFTILFPMIAWLLPQGPVRTTERSASDVMRAGMDNGLGLGDESKAVYWNDNEPLQTSAESRDETKQDWVWEESVRFTGLTKDETALNKWE